jgi:hypothetical protein
MIFKLAFIKKKKVRGSRIVEAYYIFKKGYGKKI